MRGLLRGAVTGCVFMLAASTAFGQALLDQQQLSKLGYLQFWKTNIDLNRARTVTGAYVLDDTLYITTDSGDVHAIHAGAGLSRWAQNIAESVYQIFPPTHSVTASGTPLVVFSTSPRTLVIDQVLGDVIADMPLELAATGSAVVSGERMFLGSADGHLYAMLWTDPRTSAAVRLWRVMAGGPVTGAPVLVNNGDDLIFASQSGSVYCCTSAAKILNWQTPTGGPIMGDIVVDGPSVFVASTDRSLYRLDAISGSRRWRLRFPEPLNEGPIVTGGLAFQYCEGEGITAVDAESGEKLWQVPEARGFVCRGIDHVLLVTADNDLLKIDSENGKTLARVDLPTNVVPVTNTRDDTIYLASHQGSLLCAKPAGTPHLTPQELSDARRVLHKPANAKGSAAEIEPPPHRAPEKPWIDPDDPLRSPSDKGGDSDNG
ncbi:MAG: PQQ-binding-like beta-propeller repeat protein [Phycisphaerales bacterium]|nr:PQQ-binding-like beta-propeller repeat protein [Phycisphaerales bacterium]